MKLFSSLVNTCFFFGKSPVAPGTIGSVFALIVWLILSYTIMKPSILFILLITIVSYFTISFELKSTNEKDPQHIVIDEAIGIWISLIFISFGNFINIGLAFILFRLLDILKPSIINRSQYIKGPVGILADDIISGLITCMIFLGIINI